MEFEWDEDKRLKIVRERGIDLRRVVRIFENPVVSWRDDRRAYGEVRHISIGLVDDECFVVVHTRRRNVIRVITAWKGGKREKARYQASNARTDP
jgi:uncharacterized DUF497 family protein